VNGKGASEFGNVTIGVSKRKKEKPVKPGCLEKRGIERLT